MYIHNFGTEYRIYIPFSFERTIRYKSVLGEDEGLINTTHNTSNVYRLGYYATRETTLRVLGGWTSKVSLTRKGLGHTSSKCK
jgi:hypothetical protein